LLSEGIGSPENILGIMADKIAEFFAALGNAEIMTTYLCAASTLIFVVFVGTVATPPISTIVMLCPQNLIILEANPLMLMILKRYLFPGIIENCTLGAFRES
jgi:hypothetical protein